MIPIMVGGAVARDSNCILTDKMISELMTNMYSCGVSKGRHKIQKQDLAYQNIEARAYMFLASQK
jgi:hypothetical protein